MVDAPAVALLAAASLHLGFQLTITALVYPALAGPWDVNLAGSLAGAAVSLGSTALVAARLHGRLAREGPVPALLRRLVVADRVRTAGALTCALGATLWCVSG